MMGREAESEIDQVPFSDNSISNRVNDTSQDAEDVLSEILKILTLLYKSTSQETKQITQPLAFVRFENEGRITDSFFWLQRPAKNN
jgi:hypothetical protein